MTPSRIQVTVVVNILKDRFPNLGAVEVIDLAFKIVEALEKNDPT